MKFSALGGAVSPMQENLYGKKYFNQYKDEIAQILSATMQDKSQRLGPNRMLDELKRRHPNVYDQPSESEI